MDRVVFFINKLSMWIGHAFAWCILVLTFAISYEVFVRYALRDPTAWAFDVSYIMYGALFMMAGAYTLSRDGHVRGDVFYRLWPPRVQAGVELVLYFLFFFPGMLALVYAGYDYAAESVGWREASINSPAGVKIYPLKIILPVSAFFLLLQGIAESIRCIQCLRTGEWPKRLHDVEEMETLIRERKREEDTRMAAQQGGTAEGEAT
ncbi:MAG: TRAP transporter small permease subunit [candidate division NC10 bacterium]|jgi:TRAP-type mannitol/chloroaromatic compound transport system permease small subunit|nr:TRAP transporter small permease subunit [candidate division NC10 bacterium]